MVQRKDKHKPGGLPAVWKTRTINKPAFTLIELLVIVAIVAMLTVLLIPALASARQAADRLYCLRNLVSIGQGLAAYSHESNDRMPPQYDRWGPARETYDTQHLEPWVSYVAYHHDMTGFGGSLKPLQLAYLWQAGCIENAQAFYCAAQNPAGDNLPFTYDYYTGKGTHPWGTVIPQKPNGMPDDKIRVSYHYWLSGRTSLSRLSTKPVVFDNIQHWNSVAHRKNGSPYGVGVLFGDGHAEFSNRPGLFEYALWNGGPAAGPWDGPGNSLPLFTQILERL